MRKILMGAMLLLGVANAGFIGEFGYGFYYNNFNPVGETRDDGTLQSIFAKLGGTWGEYGLEANYYMSLGNSGTKEKPGNIATNNSFWGADVRFGGNIAGIVGNNHEGLAYFGLGYRDYKREYDNLAGTLKQQLYYLPIGFYGREFLNLDWLYARYALEGRWVFYGTNRSSDYTKRSFSHGFGAKGSVGLDYKIGGVFDIFFQVYVDWWHTPSRADYPRLNTLQAGGEVGFGW